MQELLNRLNQSAFRRRFSLTAADAAYIRRIGQERLQDHARDFIAKRLASAQPPNDGKQTPMRGHPVFKAQHACACCCRSCLQKWHGIPQGKELTPQEQEWVVQLLLCWIRAKLPSLPAGQQGLFDF